MTKFKYNLKKDEEDIRDFLFKDSFNFTTTLPTSVDLISKMPSIFNQLDESSCTANAGTANREYLLPDKTKNLSRQFLYNVERIMENTFNQDSGCQMRTVCKILNTYGICEESYLPYGKQNLYVQPSKDAYDNAKKYTISKYHRITSLDEVKQALVQGFPILLGMTVYESMESDECINTGLIPYPQDGEKILGGHAVEICKYVDSIKPKSTLINKLQNMFKCLLGKSNSSGYIYIRNSWGNVGINNTGYFKMTYETFEKLCQDMWVIQL
jgi:C1A family cysteine protease